MDDKFFSTLKNHFKKEHLTQEDIAERLGVTQVYVSGLLNGKRAFGKKQAAKWQDLFGISAVWLLTGEGDMMASKGDTATLIGTVLPADADLAAMVDFIPVSATASFIEYLGAGNPSFEKIPVVPFHGEEMDDTYKVFEVSGESMLPAIKPRARILVKEIPAPQWCYAEGVVVIVVGDMVLIKRIAENDLEHNRLVLSSDNPRFGDKTVQLADIRAIYKAKRKISEDID